MIKILRTRRIQGTAFAILVVSSFSAIADGSPCDDLPSVSYTRSLADNALVQLDILQGLKTGHIEETNKNIETNLKAFIWEIGGLLEAGCYKDQSQIFARKTLIVLSVHAEKFHVNDWANDPRVQKIFDRARSALPDFVERTRSRDWSGLIK